MIELKVEDYCQECKAFSPVAETIEYGDRLNYNTGKIDPGHIHTVVKCEYAKRCAGIARHICKELSKKNESETIKND